LIDEIEKINHPKDVVESALEEHYFIATCLKIGLKLDDLKQLKYKDVAKIMLCYIDNGKKSSNKATQKDIDKLLG